MRLHVAQTYRFIAPSLPPASISTVCVPALQSLVADTDVDVRFYAQAALSLCESVVKGTYRKHRAAGVANPSSSMLGGCLTPPNILISNPPS